MICLKKRSRCPQKGQALVELLILLPVLLMLLLAASDFGKLFVISGKTEVASRYGAARWYRSAPFDQIDTLYEEPGDAAEAADQMESMYFEGSLNDEEDDDDVGFYEMGEGDFVYEPPDLGVPFWDAALDMFDGDNNIFPIKANRVTFTYNLPFFPYGREDPMEDTVTTGGLWGDGIDPDPLGPYPLVTAKGDFVYVAEVFDQGGGDQFMDILKSYGLINDVALHALNLSIALIVLYIFLNLG